MLHREFQPHTRPSRAEPITRGCAPLACLALIRPSQFFLRGRLPFGDCHDAARVPTASPHRTRSLQDTLGAETEYNGPVFRGQNTD